MSISVIDFGCVKDKEAVKLFTLKNNNDSAVEIISLGAAVRSWNMCGKDGNAVCIVLGYDTLEEYVNGECYVGCVVGRVCNRIRKGQFTLNGISYKLPVNNGPNHLHGGLNGFNHKVWNADIDGNKLHLYCSSENGEEGYPGHVDCRVTYELTDRNELKISYEARISEESTPINLTNHAFFNLNGEGYENLNSHELTIYADKYMPVDADGLVTGEIKNVEGTLWDFRSAKNLGNRLSELCKHSRGFDNNFCLDNSSKSLKKAARVHCPDTGLTLETWTTEPGLQLYTANYMQQKGRNGKLYGNHSAMCLECQGYPDAINHENFPSIVKQPGEKYEQTTIYKCFLEKSR